MMNRRLSRSVSRLATDRLGIGSETMVDNAVNDSYRQAPFLVWNALFRLFWRQKRLILIATALGLLMGYLYLWNATPWYEAKASIVSPHEGDFAGIPIARSVAERAVLPSFTVQSIYRVFTQALMSSSVKQTFFDASAPFLHGMTPAQFNQQFLVRVEPDFSPGKHATKYSITVKAPTAALAKDWAARYVDFVEKSALDQLMSIESAQKKNLAQGLIRKIEMIEAIAEQERIDRLTQLKEALQIARSIGLDVATGDSSSLYMRGSKALIAEINALTARKSNDAFSPGLRRLQNEYATLQQTHIDFKTVKIFHLDGAIVASNQPVSPKRQLIFILALILGLSCGCLMALVRDLFLMNTPRVGQNVAPGLIRRIWG